MIKLPYPNWLKLECKEEYSIDLKDRELIEKNIGNKELVPHIGRLIGYSIQIEVFKTIAIIKEIAELRPKYIGKHYQKLLSTLANDANHIAMMSSLGMVIKDSVCVSSDLDYAFSQVLNIKDSKYILALTSIIVIPSYIAIANYIYSNSSIENLKKLFKEIKEAEEQDQKHLIDYIYDLKIDEEAIANILEEKALLMFTSAISEDDMKKSIAAIVKGDHKITIDKASSILREMYIEIDKNREKYISQIYGDRSKILDIVKKYGLSGFALC